MKENADLIDLLAESSSITSIGLRSYARSQMSVGIWCQSPDGSELGLADCAGNYRNSLDQEMDS